VIESARMKFASNARAVLERVSVKVTLSLAIVLSLIPYQDSSGAGTLDAVFLSIFGLEFLCRLLIFTTPTEPKSGEAVGRKRLSDLSLLILDLLALLSFIPWSQTSENARILRLVRLTRLLLLVKYWNSLVRDIWTVLVRRERARQIVLMGCAVAILSFCGAVILQTIGSSGVDFNADGTITDGDETFGTMLWWAFRQVQDPGNMIQSPLGLTVLIISTTLTIFGIFLISFLIGLGTDVVRELMDLNRNRPIGYKEHTVLIGVTPTTETLARELLAYYQRLFRLPKYVVLGRSSDRPEFLAASDMGRIAYRSGNAEEPGFLARVDAETAKRLILQADDTLAHPDAETTSLLLSARQVNNEALIVAEVLERSNIAAAQVAGGARAVVIPTEELLALFVSAATRNSRRSELVQTLVTSAGCELYTYLFDKTPQDEDSETHPVNIQKTFNELVADSMRRDSQERMLPIALIRAVSASPTKGLHFDIDFVADRGDEPIGEIMGFVALGENFATIQQGADVLTQTSGTYPPPETLSNILTPCVPTPPVTHALVCGYRPATLALCELLIRKNPGVSINILVSDEAQAKKARSEFDDYHTGHGGLGRHFGGMTGHFLSDGNDTFCLRDDHSHEEFGAVHVKVGDWTDHSQLSALPFAIRHVGQHQLVVIMEETGRDSDGRTALAMLKMASLELGDPKSFGERFQLVAVVNEEPLGLRLEERYAKALPGRSQTVHVLSSRAFRAYCTFQATVVPGFEAIYSHLLGPAGHEFVPMEPAHDETEGADHVVSFSELAISLRAQGYTLVGIELVDDRSESTLITCPAPGARGDQFRVGDLGMAWVVGNRHTS
jgi:hypothetical protein